MNFSDSFEIHCSLTNGKEICSLLIAESPGPSSIDIAAEGPASRRQGMGLGLPLAGVIVLSVVVGCLLFYIRRLKRRSPVRPTENLGVKIDPSSPSEWQLISSPRTTITRSKPSVPSPTFDYSKDFSYLGVQVFDYSELEEATDNFSDSRELGDGGYGAVYFGELHDGRRVAVKRLYESNVNRLEQFMNEVHILARLRHQHLVTLYGCTPKRSKELLLVYEYIPNGTVADHLHGKHAKYGLLSWATRLNIAVETAEALGFLHRSDIIHRDVKTTNILLDNDFHVKVADFGLSRLFSAHLTHVSTSPQGTPGYVDPEYHQFYHLTEKSDVYSFGVMMIELISSLEAVDISRDRKYINLSNMAINKIQDHQVHELVDSSLGFETNTSVRRTVTLVAELAFRCLQLVGEMRPSMDEVLEVLKIIQMESLKDDMVNIGISAGCDDIQHRSMSFPAKQMATAKWADVLTKSSSG